MLRNHAKAGDKQRSARMVAEGTRSNQKLLALREKGVYSSYTSRMI
jgi:hypothetical protein